jgi:hypothetical protein
VVDIVKDQMGSLLQIWRSHLVVALLVGLVVGTGIGIGEGISVLQSEGLFGRYNELVAWAIVFDAPATIALEIGLAIISASLFTLIRRVPSRPGLVALQLGETAFAGALVVGVWLESTSSRSWFAGGWLRVLLPPSIAGVLLGVSVLTLTMWIVEHAHFLHRLQLRYWLVLEAVAVVAAVAFGFSR